MTAAFKFDAAGKLGPLSNPGPGPVPLPPATPPSLPGGGVNGFGGTLVRSVVSERCAPPASVHVTVSSGSASRGSAGGWLGGGGGATKLFGLFLRRWRGRAPVQPARTGRRTSPGRSCCGGTRRRDLRGI